MNPHSFGVFAFVISNYFLYLYAFIILLKPNNYIILLIAFHLLFAMMLWSMSRAIWSEPGKVPIYWGFFAQEQETIKRRYCLLCHSFKPER